MLILKMLVILMQSQLGTHSTLRGSGQKAELIGKLASKLASLSIRELRRVRSRLLRGVFIVKWNL